MTILYAVTVFLSAFLLFQVQPLIAGFLLPWFGGSAGVWTTCMVFFQATLLHGYLYAHGSTRRLPSKRQTLLHLLLLAASLLVLPILPDPAWKPRGVEVPTLRIFAVLCFSVGLPYFLLSTTSPLIQVWYAQRRPGAAPYRLYALSNLGSMLALLSYPLVVEPLLGATVRAWAWSAAYFLFVLLCAVVALWSRSSGAPVPAAPSTPVDVQVPPAPFGWARQLHWIALAAGASTLFLAVTNHLTRDVAPVPFLWVLPLGLYLLSFILCFESARWYRRPLFLVLSLVALALMAWLGSGKLAGVDFKSAIVIFAASLFICCMFCHGELARLKPDPRYLTSFYVGLCVGGVLGGLFVGLFAPYVFSAYHELPCGIALCGVLWALAIYPNAVPSPARRILSFDSLVLLLACSSFIVYLWLSITRRDPTGTTIALSRNFYGSVRVRQLGTPGEWTARRDLYHGAIRHGEQWLHPQRRGEPTAYYCPESGVGLAILHGRSEATPQRVGVLGLGAGTLAAYGRPGDYYLFYEIDSQMADVADTQFAYLRDSPAKVEVVLGDARLALERAPPQRFNLLVMDAFSGDSVPVHLLTREAFATYFSHLKKDGILAVHISNKYLDLSQVVLTAALYHGREGLLFESEGHPDQGCLETTWVLLGQPGGILSRPEFQASGRTIPLKLGFRHWTDDYSNLLAVLD